MANLKHAGRKRKVNASDDDKAYQKRQSKAFSQLQSGLKSLQQTPPNHLDKNGKRLWRNLAPELIKLGNVKQLDSLNLEALCTTYSVYLQAEKDFEINGSYVSNGKGGLTKNPAVSIISECTRNIKALCADLGLSFTARAAELPSENYHASADKKPSPLKVVDFHV